MKAAQIYKYSKKAEISVNDIPIPEPGDNEILVKVKAAAVNPLEMLIISGSLRLLQDYKMPLTLGNECSGIIESTGRLVKNFKKGDLVYSRLPVSKPGALAEYVAIDRNAVAKMPEGYDFATAAAIPLTGLTAYQGITEELDAKPGETILIPGGSGSFGQMAVPIAKALGLNIIVTGNERARDRFIAMGVAQYIDYRKENYWEKLSGIDHVIDTLGPAEFNHELSVLKKGGRLLSLRTGPNRTFAVRNNYSWFKKTLFTLAGNKYDKAAARQGKQYRFIFVRSDGEQLKKITAIVEKAHIVPAVDPHTFSLSQINEAVQLVSDGPTRGKVIIQM